MERKEFLKLNLLAACGFLFSGYHSPINETSKKKVIVVGAGASGAMAANALKKNGHEVVVLEARDRIGGRIHTINKSGMNLELGANWISEASDPENIVANLQDKVGLVTKKTSYSNVKVFDSNGDNISKIGTGLTALKTEKRTRRYFENQDLIKKDLSWGNAIDSLMNYSNSSERKKARLDIIKLGNSASAGADSYNISGRGYSTYDSDQKDNEQLVLNGYNQIIQYLLRDIDVKLNHEVIEVENLKDGVKISTNKGIFEADYVIMTVPISLLHQGKINFVPELPESKKIAFNKMPMGVFNKLVMNFSDKFWSGDPHFFAFQKEVLKNSGIVFNYHAYKEKPVLIAFHIGESGKWLETASDAEIKKHWQETFSKAYPGKEIEFNDIIKSNWYKDPFSKGSYSSIGVGTSKKDVEQIAEPIGRIHFAGEATTYYGHGYVHGAMKTGLREAKRIMEY